MFLFNECCYLISHFHKRGMDKGNTKMLMQIPGQIKSVISHTLPWATPEQHVIPYRYTYLALAMGVQVGLKLFKKR